MTEREDSHNPALVDEAEKPVEKTYRVVGVTRVLDHDPGDEFTATLTKEQEASLIQSHLAVVEGHKVGKGRKTKAEKEAEASEKSEAPEQEPEKEE